MAKRPEIASGHIGVLGVSRGGELALQLGSMYPQIKTVVAFVPANTRHPACCGGGGRFGFNSAAWTWKGMPLAYLRCAERIRRIEAEAEFKRGESKSLRECGPVSDSFHKVLRRGRRGHLGDLN